MNKKLIALILVLPMVLMMTLFTAVNTVKLNVKVPVSKIEIYGDKFVALDLDKQERYYVDYAVYPTSAANKDVVFSVDSVVGQPKADLEYKDGYIYPKSAGSAYACLSTVDGGYKARFQVTVKATELKEINCSVEKNTLLVGESVQINTQFIPSSTADKTLEYNSSNKDVVSVDEDGLITALGTGVATITVRSQAKEDVFDTIEVLVTADGLLSIAPEITTWSDTGEIILSVNALGEYTLGYKVYDEYGQELIDVIEPINEQNPFTDLGEGKFKFEYKFKNQEYFGVINVEFTVATETESVDKICKITRLESFTAEFKAEGELCVSVGQSIRWKNQVNVIPTDAPVSYSVEYSNENLKKITSSGDIASPVKMGYTKAIITVQSTNNPEQKIELEKDVYVCPDALNIEESVEIYGIEGVWTIGKKDVHGNDLSHNLTLSYGEQEKGDGIELLEQNIVFETSAPDKVSVVNNKIKILDDNFNGIVEINAKLNLENLENEIKSETFNVRCVGNGVEVSNFLDLYKATTENKAVILQGNIEDDFGLDQNGNDFYQGENVLKIDSTYDTRFYDEKPQVITLLQFRNDLYGNGYVINANNVTNVSNEDRFDNKALFNGPLNFVAMAGMASVKAQDNICFAVYDDVTINNVVLSGCTLSDVEGKQNLNDLNFVGTVVEVLGDNVYIEYSRINNGRTVLRAFGDAVDKEKTIRVNVKNSELRNAREFIVRIGSNLFVDDTRDISEVDFTNYQAPDIYPNETFDFPVQKQYDTLTHTDYEQNYIRTYMTIENSVLKDSGIFCVGIDTHFSGPMLYDALGAFPNYANAYKEVLGKWKGLSSTSYGAKLTFNGDVRMYDWKDINNINSSTLIEKGADAEIFGGALDFDIKEMIKTYTSEFGNDNSMIYKEKYVHGGIVFFGGGKNYGIFEDNSKNFQDIPNFNADNIRLQEYSISLGDIGQTTLEQAAGNKPFYFIIYGSNSNFNFDDQVAILNGNYANNCIDPK